MRPLTKRGQPPPQLRKWSPEESLWLDFLRFHLKCCWKWNPAFNYSFLHLPFSGIKTTGPDLQTRTRVDSFSDVGGVFLSLLPHFCLLPFFLSSIKSSLFLYPSFFLCFDLLSIHPSSFLAPTSSHHFVPPLPACTVSNTALVPNQMCSFQHFNKLSRGGINVNHGDHIVL